MNRTKIPWCDYSWNPIVGCSPVSEGCQNCYAASISKRFGLPWGSPVLKEDRLTEPGSVKKPSSIFVCSMSDLFHQKNPYDRIDLVLAQAEVYDHHTFLILTKRPHLALSWTEDTELGWSYGWPENVWFGITAETSIHLEERMEHAKQIPASIIFVSIEPMLEPIDVKPYLLDLDWIIVGPETGPKARCCDDKWIDDLAEQCPVFFDKRDNWDRREFPINVGHRKGDG